MNFRMDKPSPGPLDGSTLDRLVDGSLSETERHALLLRLDSEKDGWRSCALAFLEAQTWREALAPLATGLTPVPASPDAPRLVSRARSLRRAAVWSALAASVLTAFVLGRTLGRVSSPAMPADIARETAPVPRAPDKPSLPETVAAAEDKPAQVNPGKSNAQMDVMVKRLRQQGYSAEYQNTHVNIALPDGREREIPAQEIRFRYNGKRIY